MNISFDMPSVYGWAANVFFTTLGLITLSNAAIIVGMVVGLSTIVLNGVKTYNEWMKGQREKEEEEDNDKPED